MLQHEKSHFNKNNLTEIDSIKHNQLQKKSVQFSIDHVRRIPH